MQLRLLELLRCSQCGEKPEIIELNVDRHQKSVEVLEGLLRCVQEHWFPIVRGIPRILPNALYDHWFEIAPYLPTPAPKPLENLIAVANRVKHKQVRDRTAENFSLEWDNYELSGTTWGMQLKDRVEAFFTLPVHIAPEDLQGKLILDAGCGNGSQSVAYTHMGAEVVAIDISFGLKHGYAFRRLLEGAQPEKVHFVQADLQHPPLPPASVDIIHSAGVLHHTPDTKKTFTTLIPPLRPGGTFYVWLYKRESYVTPLVNSIRAITKRISPRVFAPMAKGLAVPFILFCAAVNALGIRQYTRINRQQAALALMDIFRAPYAHYHTFAEVAGWYSEAGFSEVWLCNDGRRGFGVCGRLGQTTTTQNTEDSNILITHAAARL